MAGVNVVGQCTTPVDYPDIVRSIVYLIGHYLDTITYQNGVNLYGAVDALTVLLAVFTVASLLAECRLPPGRY